MHFDVQRQNDSECIYSSLKACSFFLFKYVAKAPQNIVVVCPSPPPPTSPRAWPGMPELFTGQARYDNIRSFNKPDTITLFLEYQTNVFRSGV